MRQACPRLEGFTGWHLSYFMDTPALLRKLRTFSHASDAKILKITRARDPVATVEHYVRTCTSVHGTSATGGGMVALPPYDAKLPSITADGSSWLHHATTEPHHTVSSFAWPRHPLAPSASSLPFARLVAENRTHAMAVSRLVAKAVSWRATQPSTDVSWRAHQELWHARARLAAVMAELSARGSGGGGDGGGDGGGGDGDGDGDYGDGGGGGGGGGDGGNGDGFTEVGIVASDTTANNTTVTSMLQGKLHVLYPCRRHPWQRLWYVHTFFAGAVFVCDTEATVADLWRANIIVSAYENARNPSRGFQIDALFVRLGVADTLRLRRALARKVLVHIDDEYGARSRMPIALAEFLCRLYSPWGAVYRNYWSDAIDSFFSEDGAQRLGPNCTAAAAAAAPLTTGSFNGPVAAPKKLLCNTVDAIPPARDVAPFYRTTPVGWVPLGWSSNWHTQHARAAPLDSPKAESEEESSSVPRETGDGGEFGAGIAGGAGGRLYGVPRASARSTLVGFYGNAKFKLNRGRLIARFGAAAAVRVETSLGRSGFGKGNISGYMDKMRGTRLCLQVAGLSTECYRMYEALDSGCVPILVDELGGSTSVAEQYRVLLRGSPADGLPPAPLLYANTSARLAPRLARLLENTTALDELQLVTLRWWRVALRALRGRVVTTAASLRRCAT